MIIKRLVLQAPRSAWHLTSVTMALITNFYAALSSICYAAMQQHYLLLYSIIIIVLMTSFYAAL
jgi:hypothetical protein